MEDTNDVGHVHFPTDQTVQHDSEIVVDAESQGCINVHLGFLQINHIYEIRFNITDKMAQDLSSDPLQNLHCNVMKTWPTEDGEGHGILLHFKAYKEKLMKEELILKDKESGQETKLVLHARVLGKHKGTPSLKDGIHCTGIDADEDSEQSDWQGFE